MKTIRDIIGFQALMHNSLYGLMIDIQRYSKSNEDENWILLNIQLENNSYIAYMAKYA